MPDSNWQAPNKTQNGCTKTEASASPKSSFWLGFLPVPCYFISFFSHEMRGGSGSALLGYLTSSEIGPSTLSLFSSVESLSGSPRESTNKGITKDAEGALSSLRFLTRNIYHLTPYNRAKNYVSRQTFPTRVCYTDIIVTINLKCKQRSKIDSKVTFIYSHAKNASINLSKK